MQYIRAAGDEKRLFHFHAASKALHIDPPAALPSQQQTMTKQAIALAASGAVLGPLCDGQHSKHGVLHHVLPR